MWWISRFDRQMRGTFYSSFCIFFRCVFCAIYRCATTGVMIKSWDFFGSRSPSRRKGGSAGECSHSLVILQLVSSQCYLTARCTIYACYYFLASMKID